MRHWFYAISAAVLVLVGFCGWLWSPLLWLYVLVVPVVLLGVRDALAEQL